MSVAGLVRVVSSALPLDARVGGLPLVTRAVLLLRQAGLAPVRVLAAKAELEQVRMLLEARGLGDVELVQSEPSDGPTVSLAHDLVCAPAVIRALRDAPGPVLAAREGRPLGPERTGAGGPPALLEIGDAYVERVDGPAAVERATRALFEACRKPVDGVISRHLNRHVSLFVSRRIVDSTITPNQTTVANFFLGLSAAGAVSQGGYAWTLLGAALFQVNSILDGVDGELARVRHQHSHLGQWLDTVTDDLVNVAFWAALGFGARDLPHGQVLMHAGLLAAGMHLLLAATYWIELLAIGSGDAYDIDWWFRRAPRRGLLGRALGALTYVPKKDFFIFFCLACALGGVLAQALPLLAFAVTCAAVGALVRGLLRLVPRGAPTWSFRLRG